MRRTGSTKEEVTFATDTFGGEGRRPFCDSEGKKYDYMISSFMNLGSGERESLLR